MGEETPYTPKKRETLHTAISGGGIMFYVEDLDRIGRKIEQIPERGTLVIASGKFEQDICVSGIYVGLSRTRGNKFVLGSMLGLPPWPLGEHHTVHSVKDILRLVPDLLQIAPADKVTGIEGLLEKNYLGNWVLGYRGGEYHVQFYTKGLKPSDPSNPLGAPGSQGILEIRRLIKFNDHYYSFFFPRDFILNRGPESIGGILELTGRVATVLRTSKLVSQSKIIPSMWLAPKIKEP